jgi:hypothetical protein
VEDQSAPIPEEMTSKLGGSIKAAWWSLGVIEEWATDVQKDPTRTAKVEKRSSTWFTNLLKSLWMKP